MEDFNDMKIMWQDLNERLSILENENKQLMNKIMKSNYKTTQGKLINKYIAFIWIEIVMICFITLFFINNPEVNEKYRFLTLIYWDVFFLFSIIMDGYLLYQVKGLDIYHDSINQVAKVAAKNWKLHKIFLIIGLPLAFGAIYLFALAMNANIYTVMGMIVGGIIGMVIGFRQLIKFRKYYSLLQTEI